MVKIPKILHLFWGGGELSTLQALTPLSFLKLNPDWQVNVWVIDDSIKENTRAYELLQHPSITIHFNVLDRYDLSKGVTAVHKSDLFRYKLLHDIGGYYSDFDIMFKTPMSNLRLQHNCSRDEVDSGFCWNVDKYHSIGFLFSAPGSTSFSRVIEFNETLDADAGYQAFGSPFLGQLFPSFEETVITHPNVSNIETECFYPIKFSETQHIFNPTGWEYITEKVVGVHWFYGSDMAKAFIHQNYPIRDSLICNLIYCLGLEL